jgi:recombinational DNA repair protein RecR
MQPRLNHLETAIARLVLVGNVDAGNIVLHLFSTFQRKVNEYQDTLQSLDVGVSVCACVWVPIKPGLKEPCNMHV